MMEDLLNEVQTGLAEETARMKLFPGIAFRGAKGERRAYVVGTGFDVSQIVDAERTFDLAQSMVGGDGAAAERHVRLALAYYERFPEEIEAAIAAHAHEPAESDEGFPFIVVSIP
jgi:hypothetical protein